MVGSQKDWYTAIIAWSKVALALGALVLLSTLFLFAHRIDVTDAIIYADIDVDRIIAEQRMSAPVFTTYTQDNTAVIVEGAYSKPSPTSPEMIEITDIAASFQMDGEPQTNLKAGTGFVNQTDGTAILIDDVIITQPEGFIINAPHVEVDLTVETFTATQHVETISHFGTLTSDQLVVKRIGDNMLYDFQGGVRLLYIPKG